MRLINISEISDSEYTTVYSVFQYDAHDEDVCNLVGMCRTRDDALKLAQIEYGMDTCLWDEESDHYSKTVDFEDWSGERVYLTVERQQVIKGPRKS